MRRLPARGRCCPVRAAGVSELAPRWKANKLGRKAGTQRWAVETRSSAAARLCCSHSRKLLQLLCKREEGRGVPGVQRRDAPRVIQLGPGERRRLRACLVGAWHAAAAPATLAPAWLPRLDSWWCWGREDKLLRFAASPARQASCCR